MPKTLKPIPIALATLLAACGGGSDPDPSTGAQAQAAATQPQAARDSLRQLRKPIVIAHRGASHYYPEHTLAAYALAIDLGADAIEPDVVMTKDGVLVARHDVMLAATTNVAAHPEFAARKRAGENGDGEPVAADWFVEDFTLAELKTLRARSPNHPQAQLYDDKFPIATLQEVLELIERKAKKRGGHRVAVYPETKAPSYFKALWQAGKLPARLEDELVALIRAYGLNRRSAPIYVQSFEPSSLQYMRSIGSKVRQVQLIDAYDVDFATGGIVYGTEPYQLVYSQPTDWKLEGRKELFDSMLTPAGLAQVKQYADGIGPWKPMVVPVKCDLDAAGDCKDLDGDGKFNGYADSRQQAPTSLVKDAHAAGLFVHEYTFRSERGYYNTPFEARFEPRLEYLAHYRAGVDGVFADMPDAALTARLWFHWKRWKP